MIFELLQFQLPECNNTILNPSLASRKRQGLFSGLVYCADCGSKLHFATCKSFNGSKDLYRCAKYKSNTESCTAHFIREEALKQIAELDRIFKRIYEDDISGAISHDRFLKLSAEYEAEQRELEEKVRADQQEVDTSEQNKSDFDSFSAMICKYVGIKELTPAIVNEFIRKIKVHAPEKADGKRVQKVDIVFYFAGELNFFLPRNQNGRRIELEKTVQPL